MNEFKHTNRLINEISPYLRQHAHNPVDWYPWGEKALNLAKKKNLPIFLSIGYSACHWCHVMESESFEDEEIAEILNKNFVPIKVDREERPDLDEIYMSAVNLLTGSGGWPLSVWLTPDLKPFFGGTYFPPDDRWGRIGFKSILLRISELWKSRKKDILESAESLTSSLQQLNEIQKSDIEIDFKLWRNTVLLLQNMYDRKHGGFGRAPKFPRPLDLLFLLRYFFYTKDQQAIRIVESSLRAMAEGGIFDQIGGGFHRYATDEKWLIPHFEKMLYDNALLPIVYFECFQITKDKFYRDIAVRTLDFVLNEMQSPEGGFYSSLDADSDGEEGKFYVWTRKEIFEILTEEEARLAEVVFGVTDSGNWEGKNVLHIATPVAEAAANLNLPEGEAFSLVNSAREKLLEFRKRRPMPALDSKIITAWNSLMIMALCKGYQLTGFDRFFAAAKNAVEFLIKKMYIAKNLYRIYGKGEIKHPGYLSDYALFVAALIELYMTDFEIENLNLALEINEQILERFWNNSKECFFFTTESENDLPVLIRHEYDNILPSGNSVAIQNLLRIYHFTGENKYQEFAHKAIISSGEKIKKSPLGFSYLLSILESVIAKPREIVISGDRGDEKFAAFVKEIWHHYFPNKILAWADKDLASRNADAANWPVFAGKFKDEVEVFICEDYTCHAPINSLDELREHLKAYRIMQ